MINAYNGLDVDLIKALQTICVFRENRPYLKWQLIFGFGAFTFFLLHFKLKKCIVMATTIKQNQDPDSPYQVFFKWLPEPNFFVGLMVVCFFKF